MTLMPPATSECRWCWSSTQERSTGWAGPHPRHPPSRSVGQTQLLMEASTYEPQALRRLGVFFLWRYRIGGSTTHPIAAKIFRTRRAALLRRADHMLATRARPSGKPIFLIRFARCRPRSDQQTKQTNKNWGHSYHQLWPRVSMQRKNSTPRLRPGRHIPQSPTPQMPPSPNEPPRGSIGSWKTLALPRSRSGARTNQLCCCGFLWIVLFAPLYKAAISAVSNRSNVSR